MNANNRNKAGAAASLIVALALAGCTGAPSELAQGGAAATDHAAHAEHMAAAQSAEPPNVAPVTELPLVNTSSVLFPQHTMTIEAIEAQKAAFRSGLAFWDQPVTGTVAVTTPIRSGPSEMDDVLTVLAPGDQVVLDGQVAHWYRVVPGVDGAVGGFVNGLALVDSQGLSPGSVGDSAGSPKVAFGNSTDATGTPDSTDATGKPGVDVVWQTSVTNVGDSAAVNDCTGGLTDFTAMHDDLGVPAYAIHSYCGGDPILTLAIGDVISIDGLKYQVATANYFPMFSSTEVMRDLHSDAFVQTCNLVSGRSRVLGLDRVG